MQPVVPVHRCRHGQTNDGGLAAADAGAARPDQAHTFRLALQTIEHQLEAKFEFARAVEGQPRRVLHDDLGKIRLRVDGELLQHGHAAGPSTIPARA